MHLDSPAPPQAPVAGRPGVVGRLRRLPLWQPLAHRDFRLIWTGEAISVLGDQFYLVALPWLVLQLTASPLAVGTTLMTAAIPRAALMLLGGAVTDRAAPRSILLLSNAARAVLVGALGWLVWLGVAHTWHLYALVFLFGVADAFSFPAFTAFVPRIVDRDRLAAANGLLQGTAHLTMLVGPALAGILIAVASTVPAFEIDAGSFVAAFALLVLVRATGRGDGAGGVPTRGGLLRDIAEGLNYGWRDPATRAFLLMIAAVNLSFAGPFAVGLATLAARRFGGAVAYGTMMSAVGGGALAGSILSGSIRTAARQGLQLAVVTMLFGAGMAVVGLAPGLAVASVLTGLLGVCAGFTNVRMVAWLQGRTPPMVLGRVMSLVMFASLGLQPISYALAGLLAGVHVTLLFLVAGGLIVITGVWGAASRAVRTI